MDESLIEIDFNLIDLWRIDLTACDMGEALLSADESIRADKFVFPADRARFIGSRSALRLILSRYLDCSAAELEFQYNDHGKPELLFPQGEGLGFNLSHTKELALVAISKGRNVGVDISPLRSPDGQNLDWVPIAKRSFSVTEQTELFALREAFQAQMFHRVWCQKEAYTKGIGEGFRYGFQKFTVVVDPTGHTGLIADEKNPLFVSEWQLANLDLGPDYIAVIAYDGASMPQIRHKEF